nr:hypothetical protein [Deltaproteobacteria bacterium]
MSNAPRGWLLDTGILVHLGRESPLGRHLIDFHHLRARADVPFISCVSIGEIMSLERKFGWGPDKISRMKEILGELVIVDINSEPHTRMNAHRSVTNESWVRQRRRRRCDAVEATA